MITPPIPERRRKELFTPEELTGLDAMKLAHWFLANKVSRFKKIRACDVYMSEEDLLQDVYLWLLRYRPPREFALSTAVTNVVKWVIGRKMRKSRMEYRVDLVDEHFARADGDSQAREAVRQAVELELSRLLPRHRACAESRLKLSGKTLTQLAKEWSISHQRAAAIAQTVMRKFHSPNMKVRLRHLVEDVDTRKQKQPEPEQRAMHESCKEQADRLYASTVTVREVRSQFHTEWTVDQMAAIDRIRTNERAKFE